jgi:C4-dicarboxylate-binding protein DctP
MRYSLQDRQGMGLYVPMVNQAFWTKAGPKMQETMLKLWSDNLPGWRANSAKSQDSARVELTQHDVKFVDVSQAELDTVHAKIVQEQDKAVADAHISPELVKLVMADVGV